eukprot:TRINITY_DN16296_c0_g1_i1.p1 TRINITY_DN16296_c0_g1~~TRINITY_DN16296_c0_g1_i1.p1  ORF type:complete len:169 (+),score=71.20 TRINITY_DN16296_c0_g1_i1:55-507(+)
MAGAPRPSVNLTEEATGTVGNSALMATCNSGVSTASTKVGGISKLQLKMLDRLIDRQFTDDEVETAFNAMAFRRSEIAIRDLVRFYAAIGEEVSEEEAKEMIKLVAIDGMTVSMNDFKRKLQRPPDMSPLDPPSKGLKAEQNQNQPKDAV